ncbi:hypothetical protein OAB20_03070, partial [Winogradskyella sp.]|nr:hypothetical protein [Winogradskyella sp.]
MLNQRKNKRFSYKPRFKESQDAKSKDDLEVQWNKIKGNAKGQGKNKTLSFLVIGLIALFVL